MEFDASFMCKHNALDYQSALEKKGYETELKKTEGVFCYEVWSNYAVYNTPCADCGRIRKFGEPQFIFDNLQSTPTKRVLYCPECMHKKDPIRW